MSRLAEIPVRVESASPAASSGTIGGGVTAILAEIATLLERLVSEGQSAAIDLRSLPMSSADRAQLEQTLGFGEVTMTLRADGDSTIRETSKPGVWWNEYRDRGGAVVAAFIEVAHVPSILPAEAEELLRGARELRDMVAAAVPGHAH